MSGYGNNWQQGGYPQQPHHQQQQQQQRGFNVNASEFVPSFNAPAFVPGQPWPGAAGGYPGMQQGYGMPYQPMYMGQQAPPGMPPYQHQQGAYQPQQGQPQQKQQQQQQQQPVTKAAQPAATQAKAKEAQPAAKKDEEVADSWEEQAESDAAPTKGQGNGAADVEAMAQTPDAPDDSVGDGEGQKPVAESKEGDDAPSKDASGQDASPKEDEASSAATKEEQPQDDADEDDDDDDDDEDFNFELTDHREHLNIVFIGHVDAGKSTIGGHLMYLTGGVDKRTLEKYEREAKEKNRESWYLSWALDTNEEERAKGKTVECGKGHFTTENKHFTIIDAPGHKSFVPNMISGAVQADVGVLVISARRGEFETGFERGGQTREHATLAKTAGVKYLVVVINKMDEPTVEWSEERFNECKSKLTPFLKSVGFKKDEVVYIPVSGLTGANLTETVDKSVCPWYSGPALVPYLDSLPKIVRLLDHPIRLPVSDKYKDMGTVVMGKLQSGILRKGQRLIVMPNRHKVSVDTLWLEDEETERAVSGDNVKVKLKGIEEEELTGGYVLCPPKAPCSVAKVFDAQLIVLEYKTIICPGWSAVLHIHAGVEEVTLKGLICYIDKKTGKPDKARGRPRFVKQGDVCIVRLECAEPICVETFKDHPDMGRFTLRDEGKSVAIGKVLKLIDV